MATLAGSEMETASSSAGDAGPIGFPTVGVGRVA